MLDAIVESSIRMFYTAQDCWKSDIGLPFFSFIDVIYPHVWVWTDNFNGGII